MMGEEEGVGDEAYQTSDISLPQMGFQEEGEKGMNANVENVGA